MLAAREKAKEIKNRLWNPVNGHLSDETEVVSEHELRRRRIEVLIAEEEAKREADVAARWHEVITRLIAAADKEAAEIAAREADDAAITMEMIMRVVCGLFHIKRVDLVSARRTASIIYPRHIAIYLCRMHTKRSTPEIGVKFNRDHSTVIHACDKITMEIGFNNTKVRNPSRRRDALSRRLPGDIADARQGRCRGD
jgi:chromosomal replication initiator protein